MKGNSSKVKKKNNLNISKKTVIISVLAFFVLTGIIVCGYVFAYMHSVVSGDMVIDLNDYKANQSQTSIIYAYDEDGQIFEMQRLHGTENRIYVGLDEIPKHLQDAFIALEDARFPKHHGVDWIRFIAVFVKDQLSTGGSTITQQLVKNLTDERDPTFVRKFKEICYALNLERHFDKDEILEAYLNTLYLGEGCYGVKTACEVYFGKDVSQINLAEAACIASITKAPYTYDPLIDPEENEKRREEKCLAAMLEEGYIDQALYDEAVAHEIIFTNSENYVPDKKAEEEKATGTSEIWSFYTDYIVDCLYDQFMNEYDMTERQATQKIYYGGLKVYAAVDPEIQKIVEDVYYNRKTFPNESGKDVKAQSAITIMDYSGRVVAICGEAGEKTRNRGLNRASDSPRQPGSSIKPLSVYAPAVEEGILTWSTLYLDKAFAYQGKQWPKNYTGDKGTGASVTVQNALARSLNTVPARIAYYDLGLKKSYQYLTERFMISTAHPQHDVAPAPLATGAMNVGITTLEMSAAYAVFGNGGVYYKPFCYYKVTNSDGSTVYFDNSVNNGVQSLSAETADIMCELLQTVTTSSVGTGTRYKVKGFQTMAKTGTTSDDFDRWFVGGTPYYVAAVWYGYDLNKTVSNVSGNPSGKLFAEIMNRVHSGLPEKSFPKSSLTTEKKYCTRTGLLAGENCPSTATGWYSIKNLPKTCTSCKGASHDSDNQNGGILEEITNALGSLGDLIPIN